MVIFFNFSPTSSHLHPLQLENCDSNSRLVVDEDDNGKLRLERVNQSSIQRILYFNNKMFDETRLYIITRDSNEISLILPNDTMIVDTTHCCCSFSN